MTKYQYQQMKRTYDSICNISSWGLNSPQSSVEILGRYIELVEALRNAVQP